MTSPAPVRPTPLREAFRTVAGGVAFLGSIVTMLAGWGILSSLQADAVTGLLGAVPGVVTLATALLAAFGVVKVAEPQVTPTEDPAAVVDGVLVPLSIDPAFGR